MVSTVEDGSGGEGEGPRPESAGRVEEADDAEEGCTPLGKAWHVNTLDTMV